MRSKSQQIRRKGHIEREQEAIAKAKRRKQIRETVIGLMIFAGCLTWFFYAYIQWLQTW